MKGADYQIKDIVGADHVIKTGGEVETIEFVDGWSTSKILKRSNQKIKKLWVRILIRTHI